ncbi:MAG: glycosyltransferase family 4 protein [Akkermansiaceae bacterium]|nr:glycosyltransferase family 4 protein [Akkermansiaceae bacterium]
MTSPNKPLSIAFVSTMAGTAWGGSEELWHGTAAAMRRQGHRVGVSVYEWPETPREVRELAELGCEMDFRPRKKNIFGRMVERRFKNSTGLGIPEASFKWLKAMAPDLVLISQGFPLEGIAWMLACRKLGIRYASVIQAAGEVWWPDDALLADLREAYAGAAGLYFVSKANHRLMEMQCGMSFANAAVVSNPWKVNVTEVLPWPAENGFVELACVGRMDPRAKGQDIVLAVLAQDKWRSRPVRLNFYGGGPCKQSIQRLAEMMDLKNVRFHGQVASIEEIWANNHALVLPSRYEGLPLVIVEGMLCGRIIITTDIAGNAEYLTDGVNGFVASAPAPALLDEAMERAWEARSNWQSMGVKAREDVLGFLPADPFAAFQEKLVNLC